MKRFSEQLHKKAMSIRLKAAEKSELRERIVSYMEYHPLPHGNGAKKPAISKPLLSEQFTALYVHMSVVRAFAGVFALILVVAVPVIAERAVPGDVLYPVKIEFNEELRSTLTRSPYAQVEWETERLERRLAEARLLASEGKLTEAVEAEVATAVKEHSDKAKEGIAKLRETDADEAAIAEITFASALAVQSEVLESHIEKDIATGTSTGRSVVALADVVAAEQRAAEEAQSQLTPSYERLLARIENQTTRAFELFETIKGSASAEDAANIERRLEDVERKVLEAIAAHDAVVTEVASTTVDESATVPPLEDTENDTATTATLATDASLESEVPATTTDIDSSEVAVTEPAVDTATNLLRQALSDMEKLIVFMTNIDVRNSVAIETLVPVTLTADEKLQLAKKNLGEVQTGYASLAGRTVNAERQEKYVRGMDATADAIAVAEALIANGQSEAAITILQEVAVMVRDLIAVSEVGTEAEPAVEPIPATEQGTTTPAATSTTDTAE